MGCAIAAELVTVRFWAGARRAAGHAEEQLTASSLDQVRTMLAARPGLTEILGAASLLVDGQAADAATPLPAGAVVDVLPPFAGG